MKERNYYEWSRCVGKFCIVILIISAILTIISLLCTAEQVKSYIVSVNAASMIVYTLLSIVCSLLNAASRKHKVNHVIDDAYGTKLTHKHIKNYFDNEVITDPIQKLLCDEYESSFFSKKNLDQMLVLRVILLLILIVIFLVGVIVIPSMILVLAGATVMLNLLTRTVKLIMVSSQLAHINEAFQILLNRNDIDNHAKAETLALSMRYECLIAWLDGNLSANIYKSNNKQWTEEWLEIRKESLGI